jgi:S-formylglutathione hydrolase
MRQLTKLLKPPQGRFTLISPSSRFLYHTTSPAMSFETTGTIASFGGKLLKLKHKSSSTNTDMELNVFMPPQASKSGAKIPVLIYLSGLTCTGNNCSEKGFFQHGAAKHGIAVVYPDTSPSTCLFLTAEKPTDHIYRRATNRRRRRRIRLWFRCRLLRRRDQGAMDKGLQHVLIHHQRATRSTLLFFQGTRFEQSQHHRAQHGRTRSFNTGTHAPHHKRGPLLTLFQFLKNPGMYKSVSAFAPIANPINCPWGQKAFKGYFGEDQQQKWKEHDATELVKQWKGPLEMLIDVVRVFQERRR